MPNNILIVPTLSEHLPEIAEIEKMCFSSPASLEFLTNEVQNDSAYYLTALCENKVVGYIGVNIIVDEAYIDNIAVLTNYRRKGIAATLMNITIQKCRDNDVSFLTLEVRKSNFPAISLYQKYGFQTVGKRRNYYSSPTEDALIMTIFFNTGESYE